MKEFFMNVIFDRDLILTDLRELVQNDYKTASGWSTYADQILPLSQYVEE